MTKLLTRQGARAVRKTVRESRKLRGKRTEGVPGPSDNPATNLMLADVAIRAGSYIVRRSIEKGFLRGRYGKQTAKDIVNNKSIGQTLASFALARVATGSVPGAIVVGGGALAKTLFDRRKGRRHSKHEGDRDLLEQARDE
ncbi:hypothetical protein [Qipengyuania sp.]|uniref:hypothetical protein n=1 Tax=Qipengyuania sp. TaxID=2004515 RepID=UPI0035C7CD5D